MTGIRVGTLTVIRPAPKEKERAKGKVTWECQCDCGNVCYRLTSVLTRLQRVGAARCNHICSAHVYQVKHGMSFHPAYAVYRSMIDRCKLPTHQAYHNYGARGITVCERWRNGFPFFWEDMGSPYKKGLALDRTDNNKGYSPENCKWVSFRENSQNRRGNVRVDTPHGSLCLSEVARVSGVGFSTVHSRDQHGFRTWEQLTAKPDFTNRFSTS